MEKYLIALDMDGTLLGSGHEILPETKEYLKELNQKGHKIIISSGRPLRGILPTYNAIGLTTPAICYNGAYIYEGKESNFPPYKFAFPRETILSIIKEIGYEYLDNVILETNDDIYMLHDDSTLDIFFSKKNMCIHLGFIENILDQDVMTMLIKIKDPRNNQYIKEIVEKHAGIKLRFWSGHWFEISEIYYEKINKGDALKDIAQYYNIDQDHIIAFGDANNDIELVKFAKYGFAMKNGEEEVKEAAAFVTEYSNDENGIMHALKNIIKD